MSLRNYVRPLASALLLFAMAGSHAQYAWIAPNGTRQYSDKPPPPGTPAHKILKAPGRASMPPEEPAAESGDKNAAKKAAAKKGPPTVADREADYKERMKTRAEDQAKADQEAQQKKQLAERCASAREMQAQLNSGMRIAQVGQDGQRGYMSEQEKAARTARVNEALQDCR